MNAGSADRDPSRPGGAAGALASPAAVQGMFDRIVPRYDLMNRLMTGWQDVRWRRLAVRAALESAPQRALDVATGTGDLAIDLARAGVPRVTGLDFSRGMLAAAAPKVRPYPGIDLVHGDAMALPFPDDAFDALTVAFGLRNMPDYQAALNEMARVVRPGGRVVILEMTPLPPSPFARAFDAYFTRVVPLVGGLLSGDRSAYRYLPDSVAAFPDADALTRMLVRAGCRRVQVRRLGLGTVALHAAEVGERAG